ncbi:hypothetical protein H2203_003478 [Taxawa tesnikishii (nom. ined.)]|nr:hypothetical protein H2203_003478 [Dothideales sp. JES 119]
MPPRVPRTALQSSPQCASCTVLSRRTFVSSISLCQIGPESPKYIKVPEPPQQTVPDRPRIKGILPVPRDIFGGLAPGKGVDKADPKRVALSTKEPTKERHVPDTPEAARIAWKQRMAASRRQNLREGLEALKERKVKTEAMTARRAKHRQQEREALLHRPEREDERLTNPTVTIQVDEVFGNKMETPDPAKFEGKRAKVRSREQRRANHRSDSLHTLYMHARDFITTEAQLSKAVEEAFGTKEAPVYSSNGDRQDSVWQQGRPSTVQDMLNRASSGLSGAGRYANLTKDRVRRMAEELTGGKMEEERE